MAIVVDGEISFTTGKPVATSGVVRDVAMRDCLSDVPASRVDEKESLAPDHVAMRMPAETAPVVDIVVVAILNVPAVAAVPVGGDVVAA